MNITDVEYPSFYWIISEPAHSVFLGVTSSVSLVTNALLIYAITVSKSNDIHNYRYLLLCFAISDMIASIMHFVALPKIHMTSSGFWYFTRNDCFFRTEGGSLANALCVIFIATYYQTFLVLAYHFVYRVKVLSRGKSRFDGWTTSNWIQFGSVVFIAYIGIFMFSTWSTSMASEYSRSIAPQEFIHLYDVNASDPDVGYMLVTFKRPNTETGALEWYIPIVLSMSVCAGLIIGTGVVIGVSIIMISRMIKSTHLSIKTRKLQKQLFRALLVQTAVPSLISYLPLSTILLFPLTEMDLGALGTPLVMITTIFPSVDAIFVILFIPRFRSAILKVLRLRSVEDSTNVRSISNNTNPQAGTPVLIKGN